MKNDATHHKKSKNEDKHLDSSDEWLWQLGRDAHIRMMIAAEKMGYKVKSNNNNKADNN